MSNKVLISILAAVIIVAGGLAAGWQIWQQRQNKDLLGEQAKQQLALDQQAAQPATTSSASQLPENQTPSKVCQRDFNSQTLKTAKVNIQNRVVEIDVQNFGKTQVQLYDKDAPKTVENFLRLVNAGYYNCLTFHRVAKGFVIQGGDPTGTGSGGQSAFGGAFADELNPATSSYQAGYQAGVLAMANSGPNTNTSQFFIMLADTQLPHNYTIFGKVTTGMDVVEKIGQVAITPEMGLTDGKPVQPVVMQSVKIIK